MKNIEISIIFEKIAKLLTIQGASSFKIRSYDKASDIIYDLEDDVSELIDAGRFQKIPGIGKAIEDKSKEILETGTCQVYDKLIDEMGVEVLDLLEIRGIGGKTASKLYYELGIKNLNQLTVALEDGTLQGMKGFGKKTLETVTESLEFLKAYKGTRILARCLDISVHLSNIIESCDKVIRHEFSGDVRRLEEVCRSIEIVVECAEETDEAKRTIYEVFTTHELPIQTQQIREGEKSDKDDSLLGSIEQVHLSVDDGFPVTLYLCSAADYEFVLFLTTATDEHLAAYSKDISVSNRSAFWEKRQNRTELEIFDDLGMAFIPPELRKFPDTVSLAVDRKLPILIEFDDMRGDLHTHTEWSDGAHTMEQMVTSAFNRGLEYYAITDHSASSTVANGLNQERLLEQIKHVRKFDEEMVGISLLAGSEVDILRDGRLDFPDDILAQLDIVVASVHSHFTLSESAMTDRVIRAIENPYVNIIGHPTGRLLGRRPAYSINLDAVIAAAAANNTVLEINGSPSRLDLGPEYVRKAKDAGVLIAVNTDAHSIPESERYQYGVNVARRSGLSRDDVINTYPLEKLRQVLDKQLS